MAYFCDNYVPGSACVTAFIRNVVNYLADVKAMGILVAVAHGVKSYLWLTVVVTVPAVGHCDL